MTSGSADGRGLVPLFHWRLRPPVGQPQHLGHLPTVARAEVTVPQDGDVGEVDTTVVGQCVHSRHALGQSRCPAGQVERRAFGVVTAIPSTRVISLGPTQSRWTRRPVHPYDWQRGAVNSTSAGAPGGPLDAPRSSAAEYPATTPVPQ